MIQKHSPVITIDGPGGTGKGTLCHKIAQHLGWHVLDSGAIYRALAYYVDLQAVSFSATEDIVRLAEHLPLVFNEDKIYLEAREVSAALRTETCGQQASRLATSPEIRAALLERQRQFAQAPGLVTDGRDMGTVVFPDAALKFYLDASLTARIERRYRQLKKTDKTIDLKTVEDALMLRDERDKMRDCAPLTPAIDAVYIDTSELTVESVFDKMIDIISIKI